MELISCFFGFAKLVLLKILHWRRIRFSGIQKIAFSASVSAKKGGKICLGNRCSIGKNVELSSRSGIILFGKNVHIGSDCIIASKKKIRIGDNTMLGPHIYIYDHDHAVDESNNVCRDKFITEEVVIGNNCWIGTNTIILKGSVIGDNTIIAAGSVVKGCIPDNSVFVQKRSPTIISKKR